MNIEISPQARHQAVASIERYFAQQLQQRIGNVEAAALLAFFLEDIAPVVYNQAVADAQERLQARVAELDIETHADEFQYWRKRDTKRPGGAGR
jgi:uncharacterized protein (DUF2164 family)